MQQHVQEGWFRRNWKWAVPVGCLGMLVLFLGGIALLVTFVFGIIKQADVYSDALERARATPAVVEALGTPLEEGVFVSGSIKVNGSSGDADLAIPLSGPNGEGTLYVVAEKSAGQWEYRRLELETDAGRIDLLATPPPD